MQPPLCDENLDKLAGFLLYLPTLHVIQNPTVWSVQVRFITGNKILRILKSKGMAPELPEDCYHLIKKAVSIRKHLERNRKDRDAKFRLILVESRIHRLARLIYQDLVGTLPYSIDYDVQESMPNSHTRLGWFGLLRE